MFLYILLLLGICQAKRYVVLFKHDLPAESMQAHASWLDSEEVKDDTIKGFGVGGIRGYSADLPESVAAKIKQKKEVLLVEENAEYSIQMNKTVEYPNAWDSYFHTEEYDMDLNHYKALLNNKSKGQREAEEKQRKSSKENLESKHNVIKGRRQFRANPVKKKYRKNRQKPHPLFGFIAMENGSNTLIEIPKEKPMHNISPNNLFRRLQYPLNSSNLIVQSSVPWGISRLSQGKTIYALDTFVYPKSAGRGVHVYVLDTGIEADHEEIKGKVKRGINIVDGNLESADDHGHGTHCAGIIAGNTVGVAKNATLIPVKILTAEGRGNTEFAVLGLIYVMKSHHERIKTERHPKAVINMSLGGVKSEVLKEIVKKAILMGLTVVAAGGNDAGNACGYSPASISQVITVGAINKEDEIAEFSNTGDCVDVYAPGVEIVSSYLNNTKKSLSGTSMAAPHVTGLAALYLGEEYIEPYNLKTLIKADAYKSDLIRIASSKILNFRLE